MPYHIFLCADTLTQPASNVHLHIYTEAQAAVIFQLAGRLSPREAQLVACEVLLARPSRQDIAARLCLEPDTITEYRRRIYEKLGLSSWSEVYMWGVSQII